MKMKKTMMMMTMMMISLSDDYSDVRSCILSNAMQYLLFGTERRGRKQNKAVRRHEKMQCNAMQRREEKRREEVISIVTILSSSPLGSAAFAKDALILLKAA